MEQMGSLYRYGNNVYINDKEAHEHSRKEIGGQIGRVVDRDDGHIVADIYKIKNCEECIFANTGDLSGIYTKHNDK